MRDLCTACASAKVGLPIGKLIAWIVFASLVVAPLSADDFKLEKPKSPQRVLVPVPLDEPLPPAPVVDQRPVIVVDTLPDRLCLPCAAFHAWLSTYRDEAPVRFDVREHPQVTALPLDVLRNGTPLFRYRSAKGDWRMTRGWSGPEKLFADYAMVNPQGKPMSVSQPVGATPVEQFQRYAGTSGKFTFTPDAAIKATLDDGTLLNYTRLSGSYKIINSQPVVALDQPLPEVHVQKFGLYFGAQIMGATGQLPNTVTIQTNRGKYAITLTPVK